MATVKPEDQAAAKAAAEAKAKNDAEAAAAKAAQAAANKNVTVTFTKPHSRYSRGDIAGFPADRAKHLVEGIKVAVKGDKQPAAKAE